MSDSMMPIPGILFLRRHGWMEKVCDEECGKSKFVAGRLALLTQYFAQFWIDRR
jgi:hypothetical protein